jgi:hypothetical protein
MGRTSVVAIAAFVALMNPIMIAICLWDKWNIKMYTLLTPPARVDIKFSLLHGFMEMKCPEGDSWFLKYCDVMKKLEGTKDIAYWRDYSCAVQEGTMGFMGGCDQLVKLYWISMACFFGAIFTLVTIDIATIYLCYYFFQSQKRIYRRVYSILYLMAPCFNLFGVACYLAFCNDISQIFKFTIPGLPIQPVITTYDGTTLDMGVFAFLGMTLLVASIPLIINLFVGVHVRETFLREEKEKLRSEAAGLFDPSDLSGLENGGAHYGPYAGAEAAYDQSAGYGAYGPQY